MNAKNHLVGKADTNPFVYPRQLPEGAFPPEDALQICLDHAGITLRDKAALAFANTLLQIASDHNVINSEFDVMGDAFKLADKFIAAR